MSTPNDQTATQVFSAFRRWVLLGPEAAGSQHATGSAAPSPATIRFVEQWLWYGDGRETVGLPWTDDYVRDAARMVEEAVLFILSPNAQRERPAGKEGGQ